MDVFRSWEGDMLPGMRGMIFLLAVMGLANGASAEEADGLIGNLVAAREALEDAPFAEVVRASAGKRVIPLDPARDSGLLGRIGEALDQALSRLRESSHPAHDEKRINEVSRHFESGIRDALNEVEGFTCDYPKTADGRTLRSGYPDLRLVVKDSGRVIYLDPKLFQADLRGSSLRTFYFTPQAESGKILDDGHHLLVGISHRGKADGVWQFGGWELVDLARFRVRLKLEFQAGNRDIYREENIVARSKAGNE